MRAPHHQHGDNTLHVDTAVGTSDDEMVVHDDPDLSNPLYVHNAVPILLV